MEERRVSSKDLLKGIFARDFSEVKLLIDAGIDVNTKCQGTPCMHLALYTVALPNGDKFGRECFDYLYNHENCDKSAKDDQGYTVLHVASELNLGDIVQKIIDNGGSGLIDAKDRVGQRPLHKCAMRDSEDAAIVLLTAGADTSLSTMYGVSPLHTAAMYGSSKVWLTILEVGVDMNAAPDCWGQTPADVARSHGWKIDAELGLVYDGPEGARPNTAIITHEMCMRHYSCPPSAVRKNCGSVPPENNKRLSVLIDAERGILNSAELAGHLKWDLNPEPAALSDITRVHEWSYIRTIQSACEALEQNPEAGQGMGNLDGDTAISKYSYAAALYGAGAGCRAVDKIMQGESRNAFCAVRPPGHHAGPRGVVTHGGSGNYETGASDSHGFCLFNNISIAAAYAMNMYRDMIHRVAIVDFDVHHGNGTEETVRWLAPGVDTTEISAPFAYGMIQSPRFKPWFDGNDAENVLFISVHGFGPRERVDPYSGYPMGPFYPGTGKTLLPTSLPVSVREEVVGDSGDAECTEMIQSDEEPNPDSIPEGGSVGGAVQVQPMKSGGDTNSDPDMESDLDDDDDHGAEEGWESMSDSEDSQMSDTGKALNKIAKKRAIFTSAHATVTAPMLKKEAHEYDAHANDSNPSKTPSVSNLQPLKPLILDIGVELAPLDTDEVNMSTSGLYRHQWRNYFRDEIFPRLMEFKPNMIFISAGFDAHKKDLINSGYISLVEEDYEWVTTNLIKIANTVCDGRVVSALEGGYMLKGEHCSAFAKSVKQHVASLAQGTGSRAKYDAAHMQREKEVERAAIDKAEARRRAKLEEQRRLQEEAYRLHQQKVLEEEAAYLAAVAAAEAAGEEIGAAGNADSQSGRDDESASKKRRRGNVDYSKLSEELFGSNTGSSANQDMKVETPSEVTDQ